VGDKNSLFWGSRIRKTGLGVKRDLTAGYCGRNRGIKIEVSVQDRSGCGERVTHPYDAGESGNGGNLSKRTR